jgi:hypothetical protein
MLTSYRKPSCNFCFKDNPAAAISDITSTVAANGGYEETS